MNMHLRERADFVRRFDLIETTGLRRRVRQAIDDLGAILAELEAAGARPSRRRRQRRGGRSC